MRLGNYLDRDSWANGVDQLSGVPVGQAETAMGTGAGDIFGLRSSVNAIALEGESDPGGADGVIGSRRKDQLIGDALFGGDIDKNFGIEGVIGVGGDIDDSESYVRDFIFIRGDGAGEAGDDFITGIKRQKSRFGKHDDDA